MSQVQIEIEDHQVEDSHEAAANSLESAEGVSTAEWVPAEGVPAEGIPTEVVTADGVPSEVASTERVLPEEVASTEIVIPENVVTAGSVTVDWESTDSESTQSETTRRFDELQARLFIMRLNFVYYVLLTGRRLLLFLAGVVIVTSFALQIASIVIGSLYVRNECPIETRIPLLLIAGGVIGFLGVLFDMFQIAGTGILARMTSRRNMNIMTALQLTLSLMDRILMFITSVMVYKIWETVKLEVGEHESNLYCNKGLFLFAFGYLTFKWILLTISSVFSEVESSPTANDGDD